ncbi:MAG: glycosyltransferase [SAR324 cluster bacterium]|nr:glycosyltransferase [SAR324 cluster bacterium]MBL7035026.1 glycosyltransferase [SAR324 cluster bacterium]
MSSKQKTSIVVLIPCLNEEVTIVKVIQDFQVAIPEAKIIVFDNNSTDSTAALAREAGAEVIPETRPGKGHVVASMFKKVDADYYVIVDGDDTYSAENVRQLLEPVMNGDADMSVAVRLAEYTADSFRPLHVFGNNLVRGLVNWIFNSNLSDIMSGYRAYNRELVKTIPILSSGFEVETEMTIRIMDYGFRIEEVPLPYRERPEGSLSKLRTFHDGFLVLSEIARIAKAYKPFTFFGGIGLAFILAGGISGTWVILDYLEDDYVNKVPTAILATGLMLLGFGSIGIGILLNTISYRFRENMRLLHKIIRGS